MLMPYFGSWPEWMPCFLESCRWNPAVRWLFLSDSPAPPSPPPNVAFESMSFEALLSLVERKLGFAVAFRQSYRLCDLRLAFGTIFEDYIDDVAYFGWGDLDVIYGNLRRFFTASVLDHDVITFGAQHLSGHFTLVRNSPATRALHREIPAWEAAVHEDRPMHLDEPHPELLRRRFRVLAEESYNTPLSKLSPWRDGTFTFPREWTWQRGTLTNDLDAGVEFLYLHFMHWKGGAWPRHCGNAQWERLKRIVHLNPSRAHEGFRVNQRGFFPLEDETAPRAGFMRHLARWTN
jgi:hypothetical protein